jgi:hypothetical protein
LSNEAKKIVEDAMKDMSEEELDELFDACEAFLTDKTCSILASKKLRVGEKTLLKALNLTSGLSELELKESLIKLGNVGDVGEFAMENKKKRGTRDFF